MVVFCSGQITAKILYTQLKGDENTVFELFIEHSHEPSIVLKAKIPFKPQNDYIQRGYPHIGAQGHRTDR